MSNDKTSQLPMASDEKEDHARKVFPLDMDPADYAKNSGTYREHFTFGEYRYQDPVLNEWIHKVAGLLPRKQDDKSDWED